MPTSLPAQVPYGLQKQVALSAMVTKIPPSALTDDLRQGLISLERELSNVMDDREARNLVRDRLAVLSDQVAGHPQAETLFATLDQVIAAQEAQSPHTIRSWGWLP